VYKRQGGNTWEGEPIILEDGILSRSGWYLLDDSDNFCFDVSDPDWVSDIKSQSDIDYYFFGYGLDYKAALKDYTTLAGAIPLPPRYAFGYWWSRYWAYSDKEFKDLVQDFRRYDIPLDVLIIDMDWHLTHGGLKNIHNPQRDPFGELLGWTGYTWNTSLFPEPEKFIAWTNKEKLKTALNLHPASGIAALESQYLDFAKQYDFDISDNAWIPYRMADRKWADTYFDIMLRPYEKWGVDFWWLDWQQYPESRVLSGLSNTWWINHAFFTDMAKNRNTRPLLFHRWGGLGNHRYQIGFSGDYKISWESLEYQSYFTHTASNVGYSYWSHDIGGHASGDLDRDAELYTRWLQFGIFSPILRTHSAKISSIERRFWKFPDHFKTMRSIIKTRYALAPYTYTMARKTYDSGIGLCRPMYYDYPNNEHAYLFKSQYMYGDQMIFAPISKPVGDDLITDKSIWIPEGMWHEWSTGRSISGDTIILRNYTLSELPLFIKAGAIIPMYSEINNLQDIQEHIAFRVFPGETGQFNLYEDHGDSESYRNNEYSYTSVKQKEVNNKKIITISASSGNYINMPTHRSISIELPYSYPPEFVIVNGISYDYSTDQNDGSWSYDGYTLTCSIHIPKMNVRDKIVIECTYNKQYLSHKHLLEGKVGQFKRLEEIIQLMKIEIARENWWALLSDGVFALEQVPAVITYNPDKIVDQLTLFDSEYDQMLKDMVRHKDARKEVTDSILEPLRRY